MDNQSRAFKFVAFAEAVSWAALLIGMFFKWVVKSTEMGVKIAGPIHGCLFIAYVLLALILWQARSWPLKSLLLGLLSSVVPFMTIWFERRAEKRNEL